MLKKIKEKCIVVLAALIIGVIVGYLEVVFVKGIELTRGWNKNYFPYLTCALPIAGVVLIVLKNVFNHYSEDVSYGMSYVFDVGQKKKNDIPVLLIPFSLIATFISQLCGASVGKEGMAVQLGATASNFLGKNLNIKRAPEIFTIAGIAAGFSGLFLKPISAICFALEVLVCAEIKLYALAPVIVSSVASYLTARKFLGEGELHYLQYGFSYEPEMMVKLILLGVIFGIVGLLFSYLLNKTGKLFKRLRGNVYVTTIILSTILAALFIIIGKGRYSGTGSELIEEAFENPFNIKVYDFLLKMFFTVTCLAIGFKGGEVTPLFTIGATLGVFLGRMLNLPTELTAALGYAAVFGAGTNTFFSPIFIGLEVFGAQNLPYFFIVCSIAYLFNFNKSIYAKQGAFI